jgi:methylamine utilization protein MauE
MDEMLLVAQLAVGLVFLPSASGKLQNPVGFAQGVSEYRILPSYLAFGVGMLLIPLEFFLGVSHLTGWLLAYTVPMGLATLASFAVAVAVNLRRGRSLPCYCFGSQDRERISGRTLARLLLLFACELLLLLDAGLFKASPLVYPDRIHSFHDLALASFWAIFLLIAGSWLLSAPEVIELWRKRHNYGAGTGNADSDSIQPPPQSEPAD